MIVTVLREDTGWRRVWATISYGWETSDFYRKRLNPQTQYSAELLNLFRSLIQSPDYVQRLRRHYAIFRAVVEQGPAGNGSSEAEFRISEAATFTRSQAPAQELGARGPP